MKPKTESDVFTTIRILGWMETTLVVIREQVIDPSQNFLRTNKNLLVD